MFIISAIKIAVFIGIISRLFFLQISENLKYRSLSDKNRLREWKITPQRGIIEDYFGTKIAKNWKIHYINFPLSIYVIHGGNYSINNNKASQELIMLSNEAYFNNEEKSQLRNFRKRILK